ncbi:MAG: glycosyl hydrolase family 28-related protein [Armatimonadota bacterium]|jgi:hypothetical protein
MHKIGLMILLALVASTATFALPQSVSVKTFGAKGDGVADDTAVIQKALSSLDGKGGVVHLPAGRYVISDALKIPGGVTLMGEGTRWENSASGLIIQKNGFSAVRLSNGSGVKAFTISYPNNQDNDNPEAYPPAILLEGINPSVENIVFDCAYIGISTPPQGANAGQGMFRNITGFVHKTGIHLSGCRDVNRFVDIHWFVGGKGSGTFYRQNRVGFEFGDVDGVLMDRCFIIGGKTFFRQLPFKDTPSGKEELAHSLGHHINSCWIEAVDEGFVFEGASGFVINSTNILVRKGGVGVKIKSQGLYYNAVISGVQVRSFGEPIVGIEYTTLSPHHRNRLSITDCQVFEGSPALLLGPGAARVTVQSNHFESMPDKPAIQIEPGADLLVITGNILKSKQPIKDDSGDEAIKNISGNIEEK